MKHCYTTLELMTYLLIALIMYEVFHFVQKKAVDYYEGLNPCKSHYLFELKYRAKRKFERAKRKSLQVFDFLIDGFIFCLWVYGIYIVVKLLLKLFFTFELSEKLITFIR